MVPNQMDLDSQPLARMGLDQVLGLPALIKAFSLSLKLLPLVLASPGGAHFLLPSPTRRTPDATYLGVVVSVVSTILQTAFAMQILGVMRFAMALPASLGALLADGNPGRPVGRSTTNPCLPGQRPAPIPTRGGFDTRVARLRHVSVSRYAH